MSNDSLTPKSHPAAYIIAAMCIIVAILQVVSAMAIYRQADARGLVATADNAMLVRAFLPLAVVIGMNVIAGVGVYLMRVEALAVMGYLLASQSIRAIDKPFGLVSIGDFLFQLLLIYFTIRLFSPSSTVRTGARSQRAQALTMVLMGLAAAHFLAVAIEVQAYARLLAVGVVSPLALVAALAGCGAFYAAVLKLKPDTLSAGKLFLLGALAMGLAIPALGYRYGFVAPYWAGVPFALAGWGLARHLGTKSHT